MDVGRRREVAGLGLLLAERERSRGGRPETAVVNLGLRWRSSAAGRACGGAARGIGRSFGYPQWLQAEPASRTPAKGIGAVDGAGKEIGARAALGGTMANSGKRPLGTDSGSSSVASKKKGTPNKRWTKEMDDVLIPFLVEIARAGLKVEKSFKRQAFVEAAAVINSNNERVNETEPDFEDMDATPTEQASQPTKTPSVSISTPTVSRGSRTSRATFDSAIEEIAKGVGELTSTLRESKIHWIENLSTVLFSMDDEYIEEELERAYDHLRSNEGDARGFIHRRPGMHKRWMDSFLGR
ncbi:hypothetical protein J5N97_024776 [Dioscorea zingiberensis]|uniref:Uncharacterized protein n=1 Tax=Dioscorea zingiberensis TaxID=325984 RepID=A0A9D5C825_9LILI|nr:hypothetical protein J5N97_024776 [Dioscorea zingiberensis]